MSYEADKHQRDRGMTNVAIKISLTDKNFMEMSIAVRKLGFLQVIKESVRAKELLGTWTRL